MTRLRLSEVFSFSIDPERLEWNFISCSTFHSKVHYSNKLKASSRISYEKKHGSDEIFWVPQIRFHFFLIWKTVRQVNMTELSNFNFGSDPKQEKTVFKNLCDSWSAGEFHSPHCKHFSIEWKAIRFCGRKERGLAPFEWKNLIENRMVYTVDHIFFRMLW